MSLRSAFPATRAATDRSRHEGECVARLAADQAAVAAPRASESCTTSANRSETATARRAVAATIVVVSRVVSFFVVSAARALVVIGPSFAVVRASFVASPTPLAAMAAMSIALRLVFASDHSATPARRASAAATSDAGDDAAAAAAANRETYEDFDSLAAVSSGSFASACSA